MSVVLLMMLRQAGIYKSVNSYWYFDPGIFAISLVTFVKYENPAQRNENINPIRFYDSEHAIVGRVSSHNPFLPFFLFLPENSTTKL